MFAKRCDKAVKASGAKNLKFQKDESWTKENIIMFFSGKRSSPYTVAWYVVVDLPLVVFSTLTYHIYTPKTMTRRKRLNPTHEPHESHAAKRAKLGETCKETSPQEGLLVSSAKSHKQNRAERKAARLAAKPKTPEQFDAIQKRAAKEQRKQKDKELFKALLRQEREEKKLRQQQRKKRNTNKTKEEKSPGSQPIDKEQDVALRLVHEIKYGKTDETSGMTTLALGVQYKDLVVGHGREVKKGDVVSVKYRLTSGKSGALIDSSNKFTFRVGKGEVVQGWDIGLIGTRVGTRRKLIVPPKAGYGSQDIGAGPGAILHFDVVLLSIR